ncbi:MAG: nucleotidyltransferase family protein [Synergistaceae bacterium]|nr:nucleotidyltransferase family protein [Synergistaceae bacterium]
MDFKVLKIMREVIGIVAEYNPFHNGHLYMLREAKAKFSDAAVIIILSSNFTQRGEPAICDKFARAETALAGGADLVLELPFIFSCAAAQDFSAGAIDILAKTKLASHIAFGLENINYANLDALINLLLQEPENFKNNLKLNLKLGMSYTRALSRAADQIIPGSEEFLLQPNNMLAISYLKRIKERNYNLKTLFIPRTGAAHNFNNLNFNLNFASSSALRTAIKDNKLEVLNNYMPESSIKILKQAAAQGRACINANKKLWLMLQSIFLRSSPSELSNFDLINNGLENLFINNFKKFNNLDEFIDKCVSLRYTRSHIRRCLMRILIGVSKRDALEIRESGAGYARVLGFSETGRELLKIARDRSDIKLITRLAAAKTNLCAKYEFTAENFYELLLDNNNNLNYALQQRPVSPVNFGR